MPIFKKRGYSLLVVVNDTHCGSRLGLCQPDQCRKDAELYYTSLVSATIWDWWLHFWKDEVAPLANDAVEKYLVINGDLVEGRHHRERSRWT